MRKKEEETVDENHQRFIKTPWGIYGLTILFFILVVFWRLFPHNHPALEGWIISALFWVLNIGSLLIGVAWNRDGKAFIGNVGVLLFVLLSVLFFLDVVEILNQLNLGFQF